MAELLLRRGADQIGVAVAALAEGVGTETPLNIVPFSDAPPIAFFDVDPRFLEFLTEERISFELVD